MTESQPVLERCPRPQAYGKNEFWKLYTKCWWYDSSVNVDPVSSIRDQNRSNPILNWVDEQDFSQKPLRVLALGVGVGTYELPLLQAIKPDGQIELVGIDNEIVPLNILAGITGAGFSEFPSLDKILDVIKKTEDPAFVFDRKNGLTTIEDDLNCEPKQKLETRSGWLNRLSETLGPDMAQFDIVLAGFCLFHLDWWRATLVDTLRLLRPGGLILHSSIGGDAAYFNGLTHPQRIPSPVAQGVFSKLYSHAESKRKGTRFRSNSAIGEFHVPEFLSAIPCEHLGALDYSFKTKPDIEDYRGLLLSRGLSVFQMLEERIGKHDYESLVNETIDTAVQKSATGKDDLEFSVSWSAYRSPGLQEITDSAIARRMCPSLAENYSSIAPSVTDPLTKIYQLSESVSDIQRDAGLDPNSLSDHLLLRGILPEGFLGGVLGINVQRSSEVRFFKGFQNPIAFQSDVLCAEFLAKLCMYQDLLSHGLLTKGFSNTKLLLERILPFSPLPPIFTYAMGENAVSNNKICVKFKRFRRFLEIRFILCRPSMIDEIFNDAGGKQLLQSYVSTTVTEGRDSLWEYGGYRAQVKNSISPISKRIKELSEGIQIEFPNKSSFPSQELMRALKSAAGLEMKQSLMYMWLLSGVQQVVMFPFTYQSETGVSSSRDAFTSCFSRVLSDEEIEAMCTCVESSYSVWAQNRRGEETRRSTQMLTELGAAHKAKQDVEVKIVRRLEKLEHLVDMSNPSLSELRREITEAYNASRDVYDSVNAFVDAFPKVHPKDLDISNLYKFDSWDADVICQSLIEMLDHMPSRPEVEVLFKDMNGCIILMGALNFNGVIKLVVDNTAQVNPKVIKVRVELIDGGLMALCSFRAVGSQFPSKTLEEVPDLLSSGTSKGLYLIEKSLYANGTVAPRRTEKQPRSQQGVNFPSFRAYNGEDYSSIEFLVPLVRRKSE